MRPLLFPLALPLLLASCSATGGDGDGDSTPCPDGPAICDGDTHMVCRDGEYQAVETCDDVCDPGLGCVLCQPGRGTCDSDEQATVCRDDGMGYEVQRCDPVQGMSCDREVGACSGECSRAALGRSYIGCEYMPTITGNGLIGEWDFAVIISNTSGFDANVRIEGANLSSPRELVVPGDGVEVVRLAYDPSMQMCDSVLGAYCTVPSPYGGSWEAGAFRLRSDQPVTVYQFNPLDYTDGQMLSHSNDASLLLPVTALGREYVAATWPTWINPDRNAYPGIVAVTATDDDTRVTVIPAASAAPFGSERTLTMNRGDVLQLAADALAFPPAGQTAWGEDLTGTRVSADKPIQVLGAHFCTRIPLNDEACDHLEDAMFPVEALSNRYAVAAPYTAAFERAPYITRIVATRADTRLDFDPPLDGVDTSIDAAGGFVEIGPQQRDFVVEASAKIVVAQYMLAEQVVGTGDPSMALPSPVEQWRRFYQFHAPTNYAANLVTAIAAAGTSVQLDGREITGWEPIGDTGLVSARVALGSGDSGDHEIRGSDAFGISVYGYGEATSYWYPGGLDLEPIVVE